MKPLLSDLIILSQIAYINISSVIIVKHMVQNMIVCQLCTTEAVHLLKIRCVEGLEEKNMPQWSQRKIQNVPKLIFTQPNYG